MGFLAWVVFGFIVGLCARALMPGQQKMGFMATTLLGVVGSFVGGTIGNLLGGGPINSLASTGFIGSVLGSIALMLTVGLLRSRSN